MKEPEDSNNTETVTMSGSSVEYEFSPDDGNSIHGKSLSFSPGKLSRVVHPPNQKQISLQNFS